MDPQSLQTQFLHLVQDRGLLETIFQSIQEGIIVVDGLARLTYANRAAEQLIGFSFQDAKGRPILKYLREIDWDQILKLNETEWSKMLTQEIEITYPEHKFISFYVVPLSPTEYSAKQSVKKSSAKDDQGAVIILRDITSTRENEADVLESERLNAIKLLAAGVAHEIGNPLNALNIHLQLLTREINSMSGSALPDDDISGDTHDKMTNLKELVDIARNEVSRLDLIITQFLRAIRPNKPDFALMKIDALLKESLTLLRYEVENRDIKIELNCPENLPGIHADSGQLKQAFFNIIKNSFQAMPNGGSLTIKCSVSDKYMSVIFQDTGMGIKPENFSRIFEPHHTSKPDGSGLGLMIVQRIVQDHGGQIEVASKEHEGSSFTIRLPLAEQRIRLLTK